MSSNQTEVTAADFSRLSVKEDDPENFIPKANSTRCSRVALGWQVPNRFRQFQFHTPPERNGTGCIKFNMEVGVAIIAALTVIDDEDDQYEDPMDIIPILPLLTNLMYVCVWYILHNILFLCRK